MSINNFEIHAFVGIFRFKLLIILNYYNYLNYVDIFLAFLRIV